MEQATIANVTADDHAEALSRATNFDDGAGHKMKACAHSAVVHQPIRINLVGLTGGDAPGGVSF